MRESINFRSGSPREPQPSLCGIPLYVESSEKIKPIYLYVIDMNKVKDGFNRMEDVVQKF
jgi:hypothetical protein